MKKPRKTAINNRRGRRAVAANRYALASWHFYCHMIRSFASDNQLYAVASPESWATWFARRGHSQAKGAQPA